MGDSKNKKIPVPDFWVYAINSLEVSKVAQKWTKTLAGAQTHLDSGSKIMKNDEKKFQKVEKSIFIN